MDLLRDSHRQEFYRQEASKHMRKKMQTIIEFPITAMNDLALNCPLQSELRTGEDTIPRIIQTWFSQSHFIYSHFFLSLCMWIYEITNLLIHYSTHQRK